MQAKERPGNLPGDREKESCFTPESDSVTSIAPPVSVNFALGVEQVTFRTFITSHMLFLSLRVTDPPPNFIFVVVRDKLIDIHRPPRMRRRQEEREEEL